MQGACGLVTVVIKADTVLLVEKFCNSLEHIKMAVSWGGHESLIIARCAGFRREHFNAANKEHRMLRIYIGLEEADYILTTSKEDLLPSQTHDDNHYNKPFIILAR